MISPTPAATASPAAPAGQPQRLARPGRGQYGGQQQPGQGRGQQQFVGGEQLRGGQQAEPGTIPPRRGRAQGKPQPGVDDQRRQHRELDVVVADGGLEQRRGEPVDGPGKRGPAGAGLPAAQHHEHAGRRAREPGREEHGEAGLRAEQQRDRGEEDARQQHRGVPHQVDPGGRVHRRGDQRGQAAVRNRGRVVAQEPGEQVGVVRVPGHVARGQVGPPPPGHRHRADQVAGADDRGGAAARSRPVRPVAGRRRAGRARANNQCHGRARRTGGRRQPRRRRRPAGKRGRG